MTANGVEAVLRAIIDNARMAFSETHADDEARCRAMAAALSEVNYLDAPGEDVHPQSLNRLSWRCFHCGEVFTDENAAREHFGFDQASDPACRIKAGAEGSLVKALRAAENAAASAIHMVHNQDTDGFKAYYAAQSRSISAIQAAEEAGYERGLSDGRASLRRSPSPGVRK